MISVSIAGNRIKDDDTDSCNGKNRISKQGQLRIPLFPAPVILRKQADDNPDKRGNPDNDFQRCRRFQLAEGVLPDIKQKDVKVMEETCSPMPSCFLILSLLPLSALFTLGSR